MANWIGGSCPAMANQIAGGYCLLSAATLRGFLPGELQLLRFELEKLLRNVRAEVPPRTTPSPSRRETTRSAGSARPCRSCSTR